MADGTGTPSATGGAGGDQPSETWAAATMPSGPPTFPAEPVDAPTDPDQPRTVEQWPASPTAEAPFFHDLSGSTGYAPPGTTLGPFEAPPPPGTAGSAYAGPTYGAPGYGAPGYGPPGYGYGYVPAPYGPYAYGGYAPQKTNNLAIASMICGIVGLTFCQIFCIPALILGFRARRQIRESQGAETGDPFALAGLICGGIAAFIFVGLIVIYGLMFGLAFSSGL